MDILKPTAVIGTNAWGSALYEKVNNPVSMSLLSGD